MIRLRWSLLLLVSSIVLSLSIFVLIITVSSLRQEKSAQQANLVQTSRALS
jgi:cell division protein FtsB